MSFVQIPSDFHALDRLLDAGELEHVKDMLTTVEPDDESYEVLRIKIAVLEGSLPTGAAMARLIQLMRRQSDWPYAKELYQWTSQRAFTEHQSSSALSHIPPPVKSR